MATTNHERVGKALDLLRQGLAPFAERELRSAYGERANTEVARLLGDDRLNAKKPVAQWDVSALLRVMWEAWNEVFRKTLGPAERSLAGELPTGATSGLTRSRFPATTPTASWTL